MANKINNGNLEMKIKKAYIFVVFSVLIIFVLPVSGKKITKEEKLQIILEKIDKASNKVKTFTANFKQIDLDPVFDEIEESYGSFVFQKLKGTTEDNEKLFRIRFDYKSPDKSITIIDGSKVIIYSPEMESPQESYIVDKIKLQVFFAGFLSKENLEKNYEILLESINPKKITLQLIPKTRAGKSHFRELRISFNAITWLPSLIHQTKKNSQQITIMFKNVRTNRTISQQTFTAKGLKHLY